VTRTYLDWNATAPLRREAAEAVARLLSSGAANPSSVHAEGRRARAEVEAARADVAALLGALDPLEVVFTSGGTEANALAVLGVCRARGRPGEVVSTAIEHPSVLGPLERMERAGWRVRRVAPGESIEAAVEAAGPDLALVSVMAANNETGALHDVGAIARAARARGVPLHVDAVQAAGRTEIPDADLVSLSGHKIGGPAGAGALRIRRGLEIEALLPGGKQERGRRAGTPPVAAIVGTGAAALAARRDLCDFTAGPRLRALGLRLRDRLVALGGLENSDAARGLPGTVNVSFDVDGADLVRALDLEGVAASHGAACASGALEPSHVLFAMGLGRARARGAVRFSAGHSTTEAAIDRAAEAVALCLGRLRAAAA